MKYIPIIGLEVHVELDTESKMFCGCSAYHFQVPANTHTCATCLGLPGALPTVNRTACEHCLKIGLALGCELNENAVFARKHYAYPDLAKGYQLTQYELPFCINGKIEIAGRQLRIKRVHMEEDTGKLQHADVAGKSASLVDFNRAGVPLVEIVTEADFRSADEVEEYARKLQQLMRYLKVSTADMDKGSMRFEANISLKQSESELAMYMDDAELPKYKIEVKNLNSFSALKGAVEYEIKKQQDILEEGKIPPQETKGWDDIRSKTVSQREKEDAHDYRYFPDPDISPMNWMKSEEPRLKSELPELPWTKVKRYITDFGLSEYDAKLLTETPQIALWTEKELNKSDVENKINAKKIANWTLGELSRLINEEQKIISEVVTELANSEKLTPAKIIVLSQAIDVGKISQTNAKVVFEEMFRSGGDPLEIIKDKGLEQITDSSVVENAVKKVLQEQPKAVSDFKNGKETVIMFLIGMVMKELKGKGNTEEIKDIIKKII